MALFACLAAWLFGVATGVLIGRSYSYRPAATSDTASTATVFVPETRAPRVSTPEPTPTPGEWVRPMQMMYNRNNCPNLVLEEIRVFDGDDVRRVVITLKMTNDNPDRTCVLPRDAATFHDGDGNTYRHDAGDLEVSALGAKRVQLTYSVPRRVDLVRFVVPDENGKMQATDFDLVQRLRR